MRISFYRLDEFSIKDLLAIIFTVGFWIEVGRDKLEMVNALVPLIAIVLGGYFGSEAFVWYQQRKAKPEANANACDRNKPNI